MGAHEHPCSSGDSSSSNGGGADSGAVRAAQFDTLGPHYMFLALLDSAGFTYAGWNPRAAAMLLGARSRFAEEIGVTGGPYEQHLRENALATVGSHLSDEEFETALAEGHEAGFDRALATTRELAAQVEANAEIG